MFVWGDDLNLGLPEYETLLITTPIMMWQKMSRPTQFCVQGLKGIFCSSIYCGFVFAYTFNEGILFPVVKIIIEGRFFFFFFNILEAETFH